MLHVYFLSHDIEMSPIIVNTLYKNKLVMLVLRNCFILFRNHLKFSINYVKQELVHKFPAMDSITKDIMFPLDRLICRNDICLKIM